MPLDMDRPLTRFGTSFRLGSTSAVYPEPLAVNVEWLGQAGAVDDIELIFHDSNEAAPKLPDAPTIATLAKIAAHNRLTYTVQLPLPLRLTDKGGIHHPSLLHARHVIDITMPLLPYAYIVSLDRDGIGDVGWYDRAFTILDELASWVTGTERLALENLDLYEPTVLDLIFDVFPVSRVVDVGHIWKTGDNPEELLRRWLPQARVVHLHGLNRYGETHRSLSLVPPDFLDPVVEHLLDFEGVVTLEVFDTEDFFSSRDALFASIQRLTGTF